eukprot:4897513-Prymnesium_polylepis.1
MQRRFARDATVYDIVRGCLGRDTVSLQSLLPAGTAADLVGVLLRCARHIDVTIVAVVRPWHRLPAAEGGEAMRDGRGALACQRSRQRGAEGEM